MKALKYLLIAPLLAVACQKEAEKKTEVVHETIIKEATPAPANDKSFCYLKAEARDSIILAFTKTGDSISGTFKWLPYEKDKKYSSFKGRITGNTATAIGNTSAEGMDYKEELIFTLTDSTASVKFGEMIEGDDGIWMYKNKNTASSQVLPRINCEYNCLNL